MGKLFEHGEPGVEEVVVDARIDCAGEAVGNVEKLVAEADRAALASF